MRILVKENGQWILKESAEILALYKGTGLPAPKGRGLHTTAFHKMAIGAAKSYMKDGQSPKEAMKHGYATAMKKLGREKALKHP